MKRALIVLLMAATAGVLGGAAGEGCEALGDGPLLTEGEDHEFGFGGIVNGTPTNYASWKGVIAVQGNQSLCTGALIDPEVVLTAGHCVYYPSDGINYASNPSQVTIYGGSNLYSGAVYISGASQIVYHPQWPGNLQTGNEVDLALIHLNTTVTNVEYYDVRVDPQPTAGTPGIIVGYGLTVPSNQNSAGTHVMGETTLLQVSTNLIEIGDPAGTCSGDSGGPLFTQQGGKWVVTGVNSFVDSYDCLPQNGSWEMNVLSRRAWIEEQVVAWTGHGLGGGSPGGDADTDTDSDGDSDADGDSDTDVDGDSDSDSDGDDPLTGEMDDDEAFGLPSEGCGCGVAGHGALATLLGRLLAVI